MNQTPVLEIAAERPSDSLDEQPKPNPTRGRSTISREAEFESLYRSNYRGVERYVEAVWPAVDRDDVLSLTFEIAWKRFDEVPLDRPRYWLIGVARNVALNAVRARRRRSRHEDVAFELGGALRAELHDGGVPMYTLEVLTKALSRLKQEDRELVLMATWAPDSIADIARTLGISPKNASVRLHRARTRLRAVYSRLSTEQAPRRPAVSDAGAVRRSSTAE